MSDLTDRELLELAAKAAGYTVYLWGTKGSENCARMDVAGHPRWNPLTDDGDALRLVSTLFLQIIYEDLHDCFCCCVTASNLDGIWIEEPARKDHHSATRRAIVRAAALIGQQMGAE